MTTTLLWAVFLALVALVVLAVVVRGLARLLRRPGARRGERRVRD